MSPSRSTKTTQKPTRAFSGVTSELVHAFLFSFHLAACGGAGSLMSDEKLIRSTVVHKADSALTVWPFVYYRLCPSRV